MVFRLPKIVTLFEEIITIVKGDEPIFDISMIFFITGTFPADAA